MASKQELMRFLDTHVFNPILRASPDKYSGNDQDKLKDAQKRTEAEKERFRKYKMPRKSS
jgi:hypothetical protein